MVGADDPQRPPPAAQPPFMNDAGSGAAAPGPGREPLVERSVPTLLRRLPVLDGYIRTNVVRGVLVVMAVLLAVFSFLEFVDELDETGAGRYGPWQALAFVLMTLPARALALLPVAALLGALLGLGALQARNELLAMRAGGVPVRRIGWAVLQAGALVLLVAALAAETVVPALAQHAWRGRTLALGEALTTGTEQDGSFWFRDGHRFINIETMRFGRLPVGIEIFEFDAEGRLVAHVLAREAAFDGQRGWLLEDAQIKRIGPGTVRVEQRPQMVWDAFLIPREGVVTELDVDSLSPSELYRHAADLRRRGQSAERFELALWRRIGIPIAALGMLLLTMPFVFGGSGRRGMGPRLVAGSGVGIGFYLGDQIFAQTGLLLDLNPALTALAPPLLLLLAGLWFVRRRG